MDVETLRSFLSSPADAWRVRAACAGLDTDVFFPKRGDLLDVARAICARCPVQQECLDYALSFPDAEMVGVWGGTSGRERRAIRRGTPRRVRWMTAPRCTRGHERVPGNEVQLSSRGQYVCSECNRIRLRGERFIA